MKELLITIGGTLGIAIMISRLWNVAYNWWYTNQDQMWVWHLLNGARGHIAFSSNTTAIWSTINVGTLIIFAVVLFGVLRLVKK